MAGPCIVWAGASVAGVSTTLQDRSWLSEQVRRDTHGRTEFTNERMNYKAYHNHII